MADHRDRDRDERRGGSQRSGSGRARPWNLYRIKEHVNRDGEVTTDFQPCGVAWPLKDSEGFNVDVHFALPEGTRLLIKPRKDAGR